MGNASGGEDEAFSSGELWFQSKSVLGFNLALLTADDPEKSGAAMRQAMEMLSRGEVRVDVTETFPLSEASGAHRRIENRSTVGKIILEVGGTA